MFYMKCKMLEELHLVGSERWSTDFQNVDAHQQFCLKDGNTVACLIKQKTNSFHAQSTEVDTVLPIKYEVQCL